MKSRAVLSVIIGAILTLGWAIASESAVSDISSGIVRLHIIANSNEEEDQTLKLAVRDRLLNESPLTDCDDINTEKIEEICRTAINEAGYDYDVRVYRGKFYFPTKSYENISLPAGDYDAVRVIIGEGKGKNWWCVMYPPLCYSAKADGSYDKEVMSGLKKGMNRKNFEMIETEEIKMKPAFKLVELWQEIRHGF